MPCCVQVTQDGNLEKVNYSIQNVTLINVHSLKNMGQHVQHMPHGVLAASLAVCTAMISLSNCCFFFGNTNAFFRW